MSKRKLYFAIFAAFVTFAPICSGASPFVDYCLRNDLSADQRFTLQSLFEETDVAGTPDPQSCANLDDVLANAQEISLYSVADVGVLSTLPTVEMFQCVRCPDLDFATIAGAAQIKSPRLEMRAPEFADLDAIGAASGAASRQRRPDHQTQMVWST
jgi:hypothetical protein